jgi:hypothetical protein
MSQRIVDFDLVSCVEDQNHAERVVLVDLSSGGFATLPGASFAESACARPLFPPRAHSPREEPQGRTA